MRSWVAPLGGAAVGVAVFVGVNIGTGRALVPTIASVGGPRLMGSASSAALQPAGLQPGAPVTGPPYQTVCSPCHQPQGQGIPFAFPPLAGSEWMTRDPETPIRIVLLGMSGEIQVNGAMFNLVMPPPPALTDAQIAEAITYARTNFGNQASAVDAEQVKKVRDSLGGRTTPWTATELSALRTAALQTKAADPAAAAAR